MSLRIFRSGSAALAWARVQPRGSGRLYLIECRELVKIGMTQDVYARFQAHLNSLPLIRCNFRSVAFSPVTEDYADMERRLHKLLYRFRVQKEGGGFFYEHYEMPQVLVRAVRRYLGRIGEGPVPRHGDFKAFCSLRETIENQVAPAGALIRFRLPVIVPKRRRLTISISRDVSHYSESVRRRMEKRRSANYSHFIETLIAEDTGLIPKLQEATA